MSVFKKLAKEETVLVKNVKLSKVVYDLVEKVAEKYKSEPGEVVREIVENSKAAMQREVGETPAKIQKSGKSTKGNV